MDNDDNSAYIVNEVDASLFLTADGNVTVSTVACTLSDGTLTECLVDTNKYGRLYTWNAAIKACPKGWRLATFEEWWKLIVHYEPDNLAQKEKPHLIALFGGARNPYGKYNGLTISGYYWSNSEISLVKAWYFKFKKEKESVKNDSLKSYAFSCRCIKKRE